MMQTDIETAAAAKSAARTLYRLADLASGRGDEKEALRLIDQAVWFDELAARLEDTNDNEE